MAHRQRLLPHHSVRASAALPDKHAVCAPPVWAHNPHPQHWHHNLYHTEYTGQIKGKIRQFDMQAKVGMWLQQCFFEVHWFLWRRLFFPHLTNCIIRHIKPWKLCGAFIYLTYFRYFMLSFRAHCDELWLGCGYNFDRMDDNYVDRYAGCCQMALVNFGFSPRSFLLSSICNPSYMVRYIKLLYIATIFRLNPTTTDQNTRLWPVLTHLNWLTFCLFLRQELTLDNTELNWHLMLSNAANNLFISVILQSFDLTFK